MSCAGACKASSRGHWHLAPARIPHLRATDVDPPNALEYGAARHATARPPACYRLGTGAPGTAYHA